jgi:hypothetical protein
MQAGGGTWQRHGITADQVLTKVQLIEDGSATLGRYAADLVAQAVRSGILAPAPGSRTGSEEDQLDGGDKADQDDDDPQGHRRQAAAEPRAQHPADRRPDRDQQDNQP